MSEFNNKYRHWTKLYMYDYMWCNYFTFSLPLLLLTEKQAAWFDFAEICEDISQPSGHQRVLPHAALLCCYCCPLFSWFSAGFFSFFSTQSSSRERPGHSHVSRGHLSVLADSSQRRSEWQPAGLQGHLLGQPARWRYILIEKYLLYAGPLTLVLTLAYCRLIKIFWDCILSIFCPAVQLLLHVEKPLETRVIGKFR